MGANMCSEETQRNEFGSASQIHAPPATLEMEDWKGDSTISGDWKKNDAVPETRYAVYSAKIPKLFPQVEAARTSELNLTSLKQIEKPTAVKLPPHFIPQHSAYYVGTWSNKLPCGFGKLYFTDGSYYEGNIEYGIIEGPDGIFIYPDGSYKRGSFKNNKMEGKGKLVAQNGSFSYVGEWKNDEPDGVGVQTYPDLSTYKGKFVNGIKQDPMGTYQWPNGKIYVGGFKSGYMEGDGKLTMKNGKGKYEGRFQKNLKVGHGIMTTETGEYTGPFENGMMHGRGRFKWFDQKVYEGSFEKNELHGDGTIFYPNGQKVEGVWNKGENTLVKTIARD